MRLLSIVLLAVLAAGCNRGDNDKQPAARQPARKVTKAAPRPVYPENDVVAILRALDTAEIVTARVAREVSQNDEVLRYAGVMIKDHGDIMQLVAQTGAAPRENAISAKIRRDADSVARGLSVLPSGFNNTYIEEQVKSHRNALQTLDSVILPSVTTPALRTLLDKLRPAFVAHLQRAMQLLAIRHKESEERGEAWVSGLAAPAQTHEAGEPALLGTPVSRPAPAASNQSAESEPKPAPKPKPKPVDTPRFVIPPPTPDTTPLTTTTMM